jgi:hypothetical protein
MRGTFFGCCAAARPPPTTTAATTGIDKRAAFFIAHLVFEAIYHAVGWNLSNKKRGL